MASELKPCLLCEGEAKLLRRSGTAGRVCPSKWYRERVECKVCGLTTREYKKPGAATHSWNTRPAPAATDTGLETVAQAYVNEDGECEEIAWIKGFRPHQEFIQLVTRSQAEGLLAAERAEKRIWMEKAAIEAERVERLEADNAALAARINDLEEGRVEFADHYDNISRDLQIRNEALEAKLAAAEKALEGLREKGRKVLDVLKAWEDDSDLINSGEIVADFRAVLGGKPS